MQKFVLSFLVVASLVSVTTFSSCKKDKEASPQDKIVGSWTMDRIYFEMSLLGEVQKDTTVFENGESIEFKGDGTLKSISEEETTTGSWEIIGNKLKIVDPEDGSQEFDIQKLTDKELHLHVKEVEGENYLETTIQLKR